MEKRTTILKRSINSFGNQFNVIKRSLATSSRAPEIVAIQRVLLHDHTFIFESSIELRVQITHTP